MPTVRAAVEADMRTLVDIYNAEVEGGISTFDTQPVTRDRFEGSLGTGQLGIGHQGDHLLVAVENGQVLGYASSHAYRPRPAYDGSREVSVYLHPASRGRGVARALYAVLLPLMATSGVHTAVAVVALPNPASVALHTSFGFAHVGTLQEVGRKFGRYIDTALYQLTFAGPGQ